MESHPYAKTPGAGVPVVPISKDPPSAPGTSRPKDPQSPGATTCSYINAKGGRCRMLASDPDSTLCVHHARQQVARQRRQNEAVAKSLLKDLDNFSTPDSVNLFLGNLLRHVALKRIDRKDAVALAYLSQLLLNSFPALDRQVAAEREAEQDAERERSYKQCSHNT